MGDPVAGRAPGPILLPENVFDRVGRLCDQWERQAGPLPPDARHLLCRMARAIVLDAAGVCDLRAAPEAKPFWQRNEASKCGYAVRHYLLCRDGESVCLHCEGAGCRRCLHRGVRRLDE
jgi:hypothetical protein